MEWGEESSDTSFLERKVYEGVSTNCPTESLLGLAGEKIVNSEPN
jgi:hypothetical protein